MRVAHVHQLFDELHLLFFEQLVRVLQNVHGAEGLLFGRQVTPVLGLGGEWLVGVVGHGLTTVHLLGGHPSRGWSAGIGKVLYLFTGLRGYGVRRFRAETEGLRTKVRKKAFILIGRPGLPSLRAACLALGLVRAIGLRLQFGVDSVHDGQRVEILLDERTVVGALLVAIVARGRVEAASSVTLVHGYNLHFAVF